MIIPFRYKFSIGVLVFVLLGAMLFAMGVINDTIMLAIPEFPATAMFYIAVYSAAIAFPIGKCIQRFSDKLEAMSRTRHERITRMLMSQWLSQNMHQLHPGQYKRGDNVKISLTFTVDEWKTIRNMA